MITNSILRLFLMLSILIILAGILLIVYMQFDRGYSIISMDPDYEREQQNLIHYVYQNQLQSQSRATTAQPAPASQQSMPQQAPSQPLQQAVIQPKKALMVVEPSTPKPVEAAPAPAQSAPAPMVTAPAQAAPSQPKVLGEPVREAENVWQTDAADDYYNQLMRHNPWSPYYQHGEAVAAR